MTYFRQASMPTDHNVIGAFAVHARKDGRKPFYDARMELPLVRRFAALIGGLIAGLGLSAGVNAIASAPGAGNGFLWLGVGVGLMVAALIRGNTT
jgi:hypothetical protein